MKTIKRLGAVSLAATLAIATALPLQAAPFNSPSAPSVEAAPLILAASRGGDWRDGNRSYRGYHGSREYRRGYRRGNDGWWYPLAAFGLGVAIGNAASQPRYVEPRYVAPRGGVNAHVDWCYSRYRSYRAYDNTFQPYNGPRQPCYSPYG